MTAATLAGCRHGLTATTCGYCLGNWQDQPPVGDLLGVGLDVPRRPPVLRSPHVVEAGPEQDPLDVDEEDDDG